MRCPGAVPAPISPFVLDALDSGIGRLYVDRRLRPVVRNEQSILFVLATEFRPYAVHPMTF